MNLSMTALREGAIIFTLVGSLVTVGVSFGVHAEAIKDTKEDVVEIKVDVKENHFVNIDQTIAIKEQAIILKQTADTLNMIQQKL